MNHLSLEITQRLHEDHMLTMQTLEALEASLRKVRKSGAPDIGDSTWTQLLGQLETVVKSEWSGHFAFEEGELFPLFSARFDGGIPMMLQSEHEAIRPLATEMREIIAKSSQSGFSEGDWKQFVALAEEMIERELFHIQKEEMGFLPALESILNADESAQLCEIYTKIKLAAE